MVWRWLQCSALEFLPRHYLTSATTTLTGHHFYQSEMSKYTCVFVHMYTQHSLNNTVNNAKLVLHLKFLPVYLPSDSNLFVLRWIDKSLDNAVQDNQVSYQNNIQTSNIAHTKSSCTYFIYTFLPMFLNTTTNFIATWKFKLRGTANYTIWCNHKQGQTKVVTGAWNHQRFTVEKQFKTNMLCVFPGTRWLQFHKI